MSERTNRSDTWADAGQDGVEEQQVKSLTPEEAQAWRERHPSVSPWRVVRFQALVGVVVALATWAVMRDLNALWSALYGAGVVVLPGAVMARGITSRLSTVDRTGRRTKSSKRLMRRGPQSIVVQSGGRFKRRTEGPRQ